MIDFYTILTAVGNSGDGEGGGFILVLLAAGFVFYGVTYARYRNKKARHKHEKETSALVENVSGYDNKLQHLRGLGSSRMQGANNKKVKGALNQKGNKVAGGLAGQVQGVVNQISRMQ
ncbi:hypothetical protein FWD07_01870 [Candidatus Saccharibacteria bacterium]|nr:hypothetical protein [Candidatus Saccharibacteria bacterium]